MQEIIHIARNFSPLVDLLDIILVAIPFYLIFILLKESRAYVALWGFITMVGMSVLLYLVAKIIGLQATAFVYEGFWLVVVLVFLIVFQSELKRALTDFGRLRFLRVLFTQESQVISEVVDAAKELSEARLGALIAFERGNTMKPYMTSGTMLDALVSVQTMGAIFSRKSPLHDGAVIVNADRIVAAACILPLTDNPALSKSLGTRHRAAIGLTEETDAVVLVVSEETGSLSIAQEGKIERNLKIEDVRKRLEKALDLHQDKEEEVKASA